MADEFVDRAACELCGSARRIALLSRPFTDPSVWDFLERYYEGRIPKRVLGDARYEVARCRDCGFVWQRFVLNEGWMGKLYGEWISAQHSLDKKRRGSAALFAEYARQAQRIALLIPKPPFEIRVLDYGMGWGTWCAMAQAFGYRTTGFELSAERVAFARRRAIRAFADPGALAGRRFDFINSEQVFEHIPRPLKTLAFLTGTLEDGGFIRVSVPNGRGIERDLARPDWQAGKDALHPLEHINCFRHDTLLALARSVGLEWVPDPVPPPRGRAWRRRLRRMLAAARPRDPGTSLYFRKPGGLQAVRESRRRSGPC